MIDSGVEWPLTEQNSSEFTLLESVDSTNRWLMDRAEVQPYDLVLSMDQGEGRGRLDRQWVNSPGEGLAFSFILPPHENQDLEGGSLNRLPLLVGASVVRAIHGLGIKEAMIKWPNDILVSEKKLGGILCEARQDGFVVVGVGINVRFSGQLPASNAVSLSDFLEYPEEGLDALVADSLNAIESASKAPVSEQIEFITSFLGTLGKFVKIIKDRGKILEGVASEIGQDGALVLKVQSGQKKIIYFGDVIHLRQLGRTES